MYYSLLTYIFLLCCVTNIYPQQCDQPLDVARFDCHSDNDATQQTCEARKCCWQSPTEQKNSTDLLDVPLCFYPKDFPTYQVVSNQSTSFGQRFHIVKSQRTYMPNDILDLTVDLIYETQQRLRIKIYDTYNKRYEVPLEVPIVEKKANTSDYDVIVKSNPFSILVTRKSTDVILFDSSVSPLIFADQFIKFSTRLSSPFLYGLGEHDQPLLINVTTDWKRLSFWTRDFPPTPGVNIYGVHPFYINLELDNTSQTNNVHGQFILNSNAMDIDLQPLPALTYTTIGGIIDLYIFTGPTIQNVIEQYWTVIGKPALPPYWSLGFHLCRWGYGGIEGLTEVIQRMDNANFPYDVQWTDIDVMYRYLDFTYDNQSYHGLPDLIRRLHSQGRHYVNIIDPSISSNQSAGSYAPYDEGIKRGIFATKFNSTEPIIGKLWPGPTAFPDFTHPNTTQWWIDMTNAYHDIVPFDGMWLDANEPSNAVSGSINGCTNNTYDNPPFTPHVLNGNLAASTLCPSAQQYLSQHYNVHSMFGYFESQISNIAMTKIRNKRPFILSRSTFAGSGRFTAHWSGDNYASFADMYSSIRTILNLNMFGVVHVGADICGFGGDTTEELCTRWMQLGAFYPFMRNHNGVLLKPQDPAAFSWEAQQIMKHTLLMRYALIPYWYTLFYKATTASTTVVQPLLFEYANDLNTYNIEQQFMVGPALLISPNLVSNNTIVNAYIPQDTWYEFSSGVQLITVRQFVDFDTPIHKINVHVRGGYIIPLKIPGANIIFTRGNPFQLLVALSASGNAHGQLYWDDGDSIDPVGTKIYNYLEFAVVSNTLTINALVTNYTNETMVLDLVKVLGLNKTVTNVNINEQPYSNYIYDISDKILLIYGFDLNMLSQTSQTIQWTTVY